MMSLEELDEKLAKAPVVVIHRPPYMTSYWEKREREREEQDRAIRAGNCPKCPHKVERSVSKFDASIIYYRCTNEDWHMFTRFASDDPLRVG
jgi:hypothetical protein